MPWRRLAAVACIAASMALPATAARAQGVEWPTRPVRMLVIASAGGPTDIIARLISEGIAARMPQRVLVENRIGAGGNIAASAVAKSEPDGHTLLFTNTSHAVNRALYARLDYDPVRDLVPVSVIAESPMVLLVPPQATTRTLQEFVARVRAAPGQVTYGSAGNGGALQLVSLLFIKAAGLQMQEIPYRGSAPAALDLAAGRLDMLYDAGVTGFQLAQSGQARALAVSSGTRSAVMPDLPTVAEAGYPDATFSVWQVVMAPTGTPAPVVDRLQREIAAVLGGAGMRRRLHELGADRIVGNTPDEARRYVADEITRWEGVLRDAGIRPQ